jgi:hypothetical protein
VIANYDPNYMAASLDEAYLNMTKYIQEHDITPEEAVSQLRAEIFDKTKITTSAGLGASTYLPTYPYPLLPTLFKYSRTNTDRHPARQNRLQQKQTKQPIHPTQLARRNPRLHPPPPMPQNKRHRQSPRTHPLGRPRHTHRERYLREATYPV